MTLTAPPVSGAAVVRRPRRLRALWLLVSLLVLAGVAVVSVMIGSRDVAWSDVVAALGGSTDGFGQAASGSGTLSEALESGQSKTIAALKAQSIPVKG